MLNRRTLILLWLIVGPIALAAEAITWPVAYYKGEVIPVGNDSYYHARRILDTAADPSKFYEFDAHIHAPEGSLLTWPWAYDYTMACLVRLGMALELSSDPMEILAWIPPLAVLITIGIFVLLCREIGLSAWATIIAALSMALAPTTQLLHSVGQIDHHWAEHILVLATIAAGLRWFHAPSSTTNSVVLGVVLGLGPAVNNGLFILQLPILITMFVFWLQGQLFAQKSVIFLSAALLSVTLLISIPSASFRNFQFEFYTLSWFHIYIAMCSSAILFFLALLRVSRQTLLGLVTMCATLLFIIGAQVHHGESFLVGSFKHLDRIAEMMPPILAVKTFGPLFANQLYSPIFWLLPATVGLCAFRAWQERATPRLLFWVSSLLGIMLLNMQLRLHYFGDFAMVTPWLVVASEAGHRWKTRETLIALSTALVLLVVYALPLRHQVVGGVARANDESFENMRPIYASLANACEKDPGIVLADGNAGHYIRYYTRCDVIANNFLMTPLHFKKTDEIAHAFSLSAAELTRQRPDIKYVLMRPLAVKEDPQRGLRYMFFFGSETRLALDLFYDTPERVPSTFSLIAEARLPTLENAPYAKLYKTEQPSLSSAEH